MLRCYIGCEPACRSIVEIVQAWLRRARSDLELAKLARSASSVLPEDACFHAQQCAEKALKALLLSISDDPPNIHAIDVLRDRLKVGGIVVPDDVSEYAVPTRYPGAWEPFTPVGYCPSSRMPNN